jgi:hypothetical protein
MPRVPAAAAAEIFNMRSQDRTMARYVQILFIAAATSLGLAACAETGDFGRPRNSVWNSIIYPVTGLAAAHLPQEALSRFHLTDDETRLRDRTWRFVSVAHERQSFWDGSGNDITSYHRALTLGFYVSQVSRYRRLSEDAMADRGLILPFRHVAGRVVAADDIRLRTARLSPRIDEEKRREAAIRAAENREVVERVRERLQFRVAAYRHALDNLVVEVPSREAIMAERAVMALEAEAALLNRIPLVQPRCESCEDVSGSLAGKNWGKEHVPLIQTLTPHPQAQAYGSPVITKY